MQRFLIVAFTAASVSFAKLANAQVCLGLPDNTVAPTNLSVGASFPDGASTFGARFGVGNSTGFGGASANYISFDDLDLSATSVGVDAGLTIPAGSGSVRVCPMVQGSYRIGPKEGNVSLNGMGLSGELRIGGTIAVNDGMSVLPFIGGGIAYLREKVSVGGLSENFSETGGLLSGGFGLQFNKVFVVAPTISIPLGFESSEATFGLQASIGFGKR